MLLVNLVKEHVQALVKLFLTSRTLIGSLMYFKIKNLTYTLKACVFL